MNGTARAAQYRATIALLIGLVALGISVYAILRTQPNVSKPRSGVGTHESALISRIETTSELHAGYGVYPSYTAADPNSKKVSGFSVDVIEQIGRDLKCRVVWHRLNWTTMAADLKRGDFDVIADPIFQTIPRARE